MLKETHYFIIVLMFVLLLAVLLTFFLSYSILPPQEEQVPRRSRPVSVLFNDREYTECPKEATGNSYRQQ